MQVLCITSTRRAGGKRRARLDSDTGPQERVGLGGGEASGPGASSELLGEGEGEPDRTKAGPLGLYGALRLGGVRCILAVNGSVSF